VFAENEVVSSIVKINDTTDNGPTLANGYWFGGSVANIGDLDGDGVNDLAVGANLDPGGGWHKGTVHIMFMNTDGSLKKPTVEIDDDTANGPELSDNDRFGASITNIGDLDGDGVNDLAVGARLDDIKSDGTDSDEDWNAGAVHILFMNIDGSVKSTEEINDFTANGPELSEADFFGTSITNIGDLDGDGVNDLAVGASGDGTGGIRRGAVHIMFMNTDGSVKSTVPINDSTTNSPELATGDQFGHGVANIGDLDGDGVNDLAVGAMQDDGIGSNRGAVHIIFMDEGKGPTITITSSNGSSGDTTSSTTLSYTATFSESTSNFTIDDITVTGTANDGSPAASNFAGSGTTYTFDVVKGSSYGTVLVSIAAGIATDAAENTNIETNIHTLITKLPTGGTCSKHIILGNCGTIAINNDEYRIIDTWTNVPTTEVLVGQPVTVTLSTLNNPTHTKIHFASVYTEIFNSPTNFEQGVHIDYSVLSGNHYVSDHVSQSQLFQVAGATHRITEDPNVKNLEMFEVVFTMIFAKPMETSHIVIETENKFGIPETLYLISALKVNENLPQALTLEEKSKFDIEYEQEVIPEIIMDQEPDMDKVTCGDGTILKDDMCVAKGWSFLDFFKDFMKFFS